MLLFFSLTCLEVRADWVENCVNWENQGYFGLGHCLDSLAPEWRVSCSQDEWKEKGHKSLLACVDFYVKTNRELELNSKRFAKPGNSFGNEKEQLEAQRQLMDLERLQFMAEMEEQWNALGEQKLIILEFLKELEEQTKPEKPLNPFLQGI